jgi:hypothetical protein
MQHALESHQQLLSRGALASAVGAEVGRMLDYLSKELVRSATASAVLFCVRFVGLSHSCAPRLFADVTRRYKEERRLAAMVMLAERQRRMREVSATPPPPCTAFP